MASLELVLGEKTDFGKALSMLVSIFRNLITLRRYNDASKFNMQNLNAFLIKNTESVKNLGDSESDLTSKSLIREKELCAKILDSL